MPPQRLPARRVGLGISLSDLPSTPNVPGLPTADSLGLPSGLPTASSLGLPTAQSLGLPSTIPTAASLKAYAVNYATSYAKAAASQLFQGLPDGVQAGLTSAVGLLQNGQPAFDLASTIASGGEPSQQQVILGLSAAAGAINPIAGAAVLAAGEAVQAFATAFQTVFTSLGLYAPPQPTWQYVGLIRLNVDTIPYPPGSEGSSVDPLWMTFQNVLQLPWGPDNLPANAQHVPYSPDSASAARNSPFLELFKVALVRRGPVTESVWAQVNAVADSQGDYTLARPPTTPNDPFATPSGQIAFTQAQLLATAPTAFEASFNTLLAANLTYWANGRPYVAPRQLLAQAAETWNASHAGTAYTYLPQTDALASLPITKWGNVIAWLLGPGGGLVDPISQALSDSPPLVVNSPDGDNDLSATLSSSIASDLNSTSTVAKAVSTTVALPAGVALGAMAYSLAAGQARNAALSSLWQAIKSRLP